MLLALDRRDDLPALFDTVVMQLRRSQPDFYLDAAHCREVPLTPKQALFGLATILLLSAEDEEEDVDEVSATPPATDMFAWLLKYEDAEWQNCLNAITSLSTPPTRLYQYLHKVALVDPGQTAIAAALDRAINSMQDKWSILQLEEIAQKID